MSANIYSQPSYEVYLDSPTGLRLTLLDQFSTLSMAKKRNGIGRFSITLSADILPNSFVRADNMVEIWRKNQVGNRLWMGGLIRLIEFSDSGGKDQLILSGEDGVGVLNSRIIAYKGMTAQGKKNDNADDMMKAIVRDNLGSGAAAGRNLSAYGVTVAADLAQGPTFRRKLAWKGVLESLVGLSDSTIQTGPRIFFDMIPVIRSTSQLGWDFQTFVNQRGSDRTYEGGSPTVFGREWGNLEQPRLVYDYTQEITYAYVGGKGSGTGREIVERPSASRVSLSPWARREKFIDGANIPEGSGADITAALQEKGDQALEEGKPRIIFTGGIKDTPETRFGVDWDFGDKVVALYRERQFDADIDAIAIVVDQNGLEKIDGRITVTT